MAETMEEYMSKTRMNYGSGVARPKYDNKDHFELKGQFLKELRENTFSGSDNVDANEHIEKVLEIEVILFYNGLDVPTRQILDSRGAIPTKTAADGLAAIQAQLNNLGREIKKPWTEPFIVRDKTNDDFFPSTVMENETDIADANEALSQNTDRKVIESKENTRKKGQ
ncbi:hypothetical protein Tco_1094042 [Tanacetum coccineum]|uniref:Uncharacterized protein n=1 Tax=Tanacetum coccineum TaxID=301880 RepID=A0ABQ5IFS4_9ASTR